MIVVYTSKPFLSRLLAHHFSNKFPNKKIIYLHSMYFMNVAFNYPENIKWKEFPVIRPTLLQVRDIKYWMPKAFDGKNLFPVEISFQEIIQCEKMIFAADFCDTDAYLFHEFIELVFNRKIKDIDIQILNIYACADAEILKAFDKMSCLDSSFEALINQGKIKKYFDYSFNFNSFALLGRAYKRLSEHHHLNMTQRDELKNIFISKNMLQLLYFIREKQNIGINYTEGKLLHQMNNWKGTGKYTFKAKVGNCASALSIMNNLITLELLSNNGKILSITKTGEDFLNFLPKDCMDADLPFRIHLWCQQPFEESKAKIDVYLNSYFKKVKNKLKVLPS